MRSLDNAVVSCSIAGRVDTPTMSPDLAVTPESITESDVEQVFEFLGPKGTGAT